MYKGMRHSSGQMSHEMTSMTNTMTLKISSRKTTLRHWSQVFVIYCFEVHESCIAMKFGKISNRSAVFPLFTFHTFFVVIIVVVRPSREFGFMSSHRNYVSLAKENREAPLQILEIPVIDRSFFLSFVFPPSFPQHYFIIWIIWMCYIKSRRNHRIT